MANCTGSNSKGMSKYRGRLLKLRRTDDPRGSWEPLRGTFPIDHYRFAGGESASAMARRCCRTLQHRLESPTQSREFSHEGCRAGRLAPLQRRPAQATKIGGQCL